MILSLDRSIKLVEEYEGNEEQCVFLNTKHTTTSATSTTNSVDDVSEEGSECVTDAIVEEGQTGEYALRARAIATAQGDWDRDMDWDMDGMVKASTDTYVLFTVCDVKSAVEVKQPKGIFDSFMPDNQDDVEVEVEVEDEAQA